MAILPISSSQKQKRAADSSAGRFLVTVNVISSAGPIRFVVKEGEIVSTVIETALRCYAREGRRPILGSDVHEFALYCANSESDLLNLWDRIWSSGSRRFVLCKKQQLMVEPDVAVTIPEVSGSRGEAEPARRGSGGGVWKAWLHSLKISSQ